MDYIDLDGNLVKRETGQDRILKFLYDTAFGRVLLKPLVMSGVSKLSGKILSSGISALFIPHFIKKAEIDMSEYARGGYLSFNDFFTRTILTGKRIPDADENVLISPCDCLATVYEIHDDVTFSIKHTEYTVRSLLHSQKLAKHYRNGYIYILRLTVSDYHRYVYAVTGRQSRNYHIKGVFHTVNPIANDYLPIYKENTREFTRIRSDIFGDVIQMEVGALMVGKISNHSESGYVLRGEEKGYFEYGGSTIVLITEHESVNPRKDILYNTANGLETKVLQGQSLGHAYSGG